MTSIVRAGPLTARVRECWIDRANLRLSADHPTWTDQPTIHALVIQSIAVEEAHRQQGHCRRFLAEVCADPRFEMVVMEGVGNEVLAAALLRWDWTCDPGVMDFYRLTTELAS